MLERENEIDSQEMPEPAVHFNSLFLVTLPLFAFSLLPQMLTIVGIPFALGCVRRLSAAKTYIETKDMEPLRREGAFGRFEKRGNFLVVFNSLSLLFLALGLLPWVSIIGLLLPVFNAIQRRVTKGRAKGVSFLEFRASLQG